MSKKTSSQRFWAKVIQTAANGCWIWTGSKKPSGHGNFNIGNKRFLSAHVYAYREVIGEFHTGLHLHHNCENQTCVNPFHLEPLTLFQHFFRHRKPGSVRQTPSEGNPLIPCACGCGNTLHKFDWDKRPRKFIAGHSWTALSKEQKDQALRLRARGFTLSQIGTSFNVSKFVIQRICKTS